MTSSSSSVAPSKFRVHQWERDERNPVLPPGPNEFDEGCCMNPWVIRQGDEYFLFYGGGTKEGARRICLAIASVNDVSTWKRLGPIFDVGGPGSFDAAWAVLPCVHKFGDKWHLYYTGRNPELGEGLQCFTGIGLATSTDLIHWTKYSDEQVLRGDGFPQWPDNKGIAGGGSIIELPQEDGRILYRMYYTLATGTPKKGDILVDQAKHSVIAHSYDGINWFDKRVILGPRLEADYENAATIALNIWREGQGWRAIYAGIGTRWGYYSMCEASSTDLLNWERGEPEENLTLKPQGDGWESKMVEYPHVIEENGRLRLFYCGNGYGTTGIGTALSDKLEA